MLTVHTPATVRPHVEEATNERHARRHGAVGIILDGDVIAAHVHATLDEHECDAEPADCTSIRVDELLLLTSPIGEVAVIGTEGVGEAVSLESDEIPIWIAIGWSWELVRVPARVVQSAMTQEGADVADFVRLFGDRLDNNAFIWRRFAGAV